MQIIKYCMLFLVFILSNVIGNYIAKGYMLRLEELEEIKNALHMNQYLKYLEKLVRILVKIYQICFLRQKKK